MTMLIIKVSYASKQSLSDIIKKLSSSMQKRLTACKADARAGLALNAGIGPSSGDSGTGDVAQRAWTQAAAQSRRRYQLVARLAGKSRERRCQAYQVQQRAAAGA